MLALVVLELELVSCFGLELKLELVSCFGLELELELVSCFGLELKLELVSCFGSELELELVSCFGLELELNLGAQGCVGETCPSPCCHWQGVRQGPAGRHCRCRWNVSCALCSVSCLRDHKQQKSRHACSHALTSS